jgi:hypothetical protein
MSTTRDDLIFAAYHRAIALVDYHKQHEFKIQTILADKSLTKDENQK